MDRRHCQLATCRSPSRMIPSQSGSNGSNSLKFGLNHRDGMKAASELKEEEQPKRNSSINIDQFQEAFTFLSSIDRRIPPEVAKKAISLISSARLLHDFDLSQAHLVELKFTNVLALVFPLPEISRFSMPPPLKS